MRLFRNNSGEEIKIGDSVTTALKIKGVVTDFIFPTGKLPYPKGRVVLRLEDGTDYKISPTILGATYRDSWEPPKRTLPRLDLIEKSEPTYGPEPVIKDKAMTRLLEDLKL